MKSTFNVMVLRALGYFQDTDIVLFRKNCWSLKCRKPGIDVEFLVAALKLAGLEAEVIPFDFSAVNAIEMIANGSADLTVHAIVQNAERFKKVDFTLPINYIVYGYVMMEDQNFEVNDFILHSLHPEVIFLLLFGIFLSSVVTWIFSKRKRSYWGWLLSSVRILLHQDTPHQKIRYTLANAIFMISWIWFCFFFTRRFESAMMSALTLSTKKGYDFVNLDGLLDSVERNGWRIVVQDEIGWDPMIFCRQSQCARLEKALKQAIHFSKERDPFDYMPSKSVMFVGLHEHSISADIVMIRKRKLLFIKDSSLQPSHLSYALNKKLPKKVLEKLNRGLETLLGSYTYFASRYTTPYAPYRRAVHSPSEFYVLGLIYLWPLFRFYFILIGVSVGVLLIEVILSYRFRASYELTAISF